MKKSISIICPVYNEQESIGLFCKELTECLSQIEEQYSWEVLLCTDKSKDKSFEIIEQICQKNEKIKAIFMSSRFGHQAALLAGIDHCKSDIAIMMDSDLQHPPSLLPKLLEAYENGNNIVITEKDESEGVSIKNRIFSYLYYKLLDSISDSPIHRHASDFRLIDKQVIELFQTQIRERNFFLRGLISWVGFKQSVVRFKVQNRAAGRSKYQFTRLISLAITGLTSFSTKPLRMTIYIGLCTSFIALIFILHTVISYMFFEHPIKGWASLAVLIAFFSGIQLFFLGILGEYIGAIFNEVKFRPHYIVEKTINLNKK